MFNRKKKEKNNAEMIISAHTRLSYDSSQSHRNNNTLIIGSKDDIDNSFIRPNITSGNTNFVITDPAGELYESTASVLKERYDIMILDYTGRYSSNRYNPFHYIKSEKDVFILVETLMKNTTPAGSHSGDPFWEKAEKLLLNVAILYLWHMYPEDRQTLSNVYEITSLLEEQLDRLFERMRKADPQSLVARQYFALKARMTEDTFKQIQDSIANALRPFTCEDIKHITSSDDLNLDDFDKKDSALFIITERDDKGKDKDAFKLITEMLYAQLMYNLSAYADKNTVSLKHHTTFYLNKDADMSSSKLEEKLATIRSHNISAVISLSSIEEFKRIYGDEVPDGIPSRRSDLIADSCDTKIYFGSTVVSDEWFSEQCGRKSSGIIPLHSRIKRTDTFEDCLLTPDEIRRICPGKCIIRERGEAPIIDDIYTSDAANVIGLTVLLPTKQQTDKADIVDLSVYTSADAGTTVSEEAASSESLADDIKEDDDKKKLIAAAEEYDKKQEELKKKNAGGYGGSDKKSYTVNEALKLIRIKEDRIRKLKEQIKQGSCTYVTLSETDDATPKDEMEAMRAKTQAQKDRYHKTQEIQHKIFEISQETEAIADIKRQIRHYDAETVPEEMKMWGTTIEELKDGLPALKEQRELLQQMVSVAEETSECPSVKDDGRVYVKKTLYDIKELEKDLYALTFKIAFWEECIEEAYTSEEAISVSGEIWI